MTIPSFIEAGGLKIPITDGWGGPQLDHLAPFEPLAWVVNEWIHGTFPDLLERMERGEEASYGRGGAGPAMEEDLTAEAKDLWRTLTGNELKHDVVLVGSVMIHPSFLLPRSALVEILHAVAKVRAEAAMRPRLPSGLASTDGSASVSRRAELFTQTPTNQPPTEEERVALGLVEDLAEAVDEAQANARTADDRARTANMRRRLLERLEFHGLLDDDRVPEKRAYLEGFRLPRLRDYMDSAKALRAYYRSPTRARVIRESPPQRLLDGSVSLDWFRLPTITPAGKTRESWLALAEHLLQVSSQIGNAGEIFANVEGQHCSILWRRDYNNPAVVAALSVDNCPYR